MLHLLLLTLFQGKQMNNLKSVPLLAACTFALAGCASIGGTKSALRFDDGNVYEITAYTAATGGACDVEVILTNNTRSPISPFLKLTALKGANTLGETLIAFPTTYPNGKSGQWGLITRPASVHCSELTLRGTQTIY